MKTIYIWGTAARYPNYLHAIEAAGAQVQFGGDFSKCGGLLLPGGGDLEPWRYGQENTHSRSLEPERDAAELMLLEHFTTLRKPVLGICRGLQTINVFFGGTLLQDVPGHSAVGQIDRLHTVKTVPSPLLSLCGESCVVNSAHHQAIDQIGNGVQAIQWAPDGTVEALHHKRLPVWGVQWHPERLGGVIPHSMFQAFLALCT